MSALLHVFGSARIECADDEATLWVRTAMESVSVELTPRNIEQIEAACAEARKYHAMEKVA
jgi:hypothetical protein